MERTAPAAAAHTATPSGAVIATLDAANWSRRTPLARYRSWKAVMVGPAGSVGSSPARCALTTSAAAYPVNAGSTSTRHIALSQRSTCSVDTAAR